MPRGSKPGERRGGRQKGTTNKATAALRKAQEEARAQLFAEFGPDQIDKLGPLDVLEAVMRGAVRMKDAQLAHNAARALAPYRHARRMAIAHMTPAALDVDLSDAPDELLDQLRGYLKSVEGPVIDGEAEEDGDSDE